MKQQIMQVLRGTGLLSTADSLRYQAHRLRNRGKNRAFLERSPNFAAPPAHLLYEISSSVDLEWYDRSGQKWAEVFSGLIRKHAPDTSSICEWGCGVGRIVRHIKAERVVGMDYDGRMVDWCSSAIPDVEFYTNGLMPPTRFKDGELDAVYSFSVFTHLSEEAHIAWINEMARISKLFVFTTMSDYCARNLIGEERRRYEAGELVARSSQREGERIFTAYESPAFVRKLLRGKTVLEHIPADGKAAIQDIWVARM